MKLNFFSITNYRSITTAHKIAISDFTVLLGKNNEGKSNILKALDTALFLLQNNSFTSRTISSSFYKYNRKIDMYNWENDFPISLQLRKSGLQTIFKLEFLLDNDDRNSFKDSIKSTINESLTIEIKIGKDNSPNIKILEKRGKGGVTLNKKIAKITRFIAQKIIFNYIPAVRTENDSMQVVKKMLLSKMKEIEKSPDYIAALDTIKQIQQPILDTLSDTIKKPLIDFIPSIKDVNITIPDDARRLSMRNDFEIIIDDGTPTNLYYKGDGVKSLVALSLLRDNSPSHGTSIIAIEEPESHLHPGAIHQINDVVCSLSETNQIILTTHNPIFVARDNLKANIIIDNGKATHTKNIKEIRDILGIRASDNLVNANFVLVVEGDDDIISLKAILSHFSKVIEAAIKSHSLIFYSLNGASNLSYALTLLRNSLCMYHCFLDDDPAGKDAYAKAEQYSLLKMKDVTFTKCNGNTNSEFEDCLDLNLYKDLIFNEFGVNLNTSKFKSNAVWSDRVKNCFYGAGKQWSAHIEAKVKSTVANAVKNNPERALNKHKQGSIDALITNLENMITQHKAVN